MIKYVAFIVLYLSFLPVISQEIITLPHEKPDAVTWVGQEKAYYSDIWETKVVTNVSIPTLHIYKPETETSTGAAVIIAPGGGLYAHSIESEGTQVAEWLNKKGITALVLKYRLVPTGEDGVAEITELGQNDLDKLMEEVGKVMPYSILDGLEAVTYARQNSKKLGIDPDKIGFMGFSAGGAVTMGVAYQCDAGNRPDFLVPVYPWTYAVPVQKPKADAPPMLVICASDDSLGLAAGAVELYNSWYNEKLSVGMHLYSKGDHGFGMRKNNLPSDHWIERFYDWSVAEGITVPQE